MTNENNKHQPNSPLLILSLTKQLLCHFDLLGQSSAELRATHMLAAHPATHTEVWSKGEHQDFHKKGEFQPTWLKISLREEEKNSLVGRNFFKVIYL